MEESNPLIFRFNLETTKEEGHPAGLFQVSKLNTNLGDPDFYYLRVGDFGYDLSEERLTQLRDLITEALNT